MNHTKPVLNKIVANLLFAAGLLIPKDNITWNITHKKAICHRLFNTAQPNACRKLVPTAVGMMKENMATDF
jgi:hypothetical protein